MNWAIVLLTLKCHTAFCTILLTRAELSAIVLFRCEHLDGHTLVCDLSRYLYRVGLQKFRAYQLHVQRARDVYATWTAPVSGAALDRKLVNSSGNVKHNVQLHILIKKVTHVVYFPSVVYNITIIPITFLFNIRR